MLSKKINARIVLFLLIFSISILPMGFIQTTINAVALNINVYFIRSFLIKSREGMEVIITINAQKNWDWKFELLSSNPITKYWNECTIQTKSVDKNKLKSVNRGSPKDNKFVCEKIHVKFDYHRVNTFNMNIKRNYHWQFPMEWV